MKSRVLLPAVILTLLLPLSQALAETRYVSDQLVITVRSQKGNTYQTLETLLTDSPMEILDEDKTYVKVRTEKGTEGFVLKQYVTKNTPKAIQINRLQAKLTQLEQALEEIQKNSEQSQKTASAQQSQANELRTQLSQTSQKLETVSASYQQLLKDSENVLNLSSENEQLIVQKNQMVNELEILREENQGFHRSNMIQWFLAGAGVFLGGWIIGKISRKKQRGFSSI